MSETPKRNQDLRFRNVSLHSGRRTEHGALYLTRHHLLFSYLPDAEKVEHSATSTGTQSHHDSSSHDPSASSTGSSTSDGGSAASSSARIDGEAHSSGAPPVPDEPQNNSVKSKARCKTDKQIDLRHKPRPRDIWVPYSMINHCVLRPTHAQGRNVQSGNDRNYTNAGDHDELFPPTFGTSTYERPSSDSGRPAPYASTPRPASPSGQSVDDVVVADSGRQPAIRVRCKDFRMMALHFYAVESGSSADEIARQAFYAMRSRCCVDSIEDLHAFHFHPPKEEVKTVSIGYDARREYDRMGINGKAADGPGAAWRISEINHDYAYSPTYPSVLCVPRTISDNILKYGGVFRSRARIPCLAYLHSNGGSLTRSSQPKVGIQNKRNPQDERLVSAIFWSHTPPLQSPEDSPLQAPSLASPSTTTLDSGTTDPMMGDGDIPGLPLSQSDTALDEKQDEKLTPARKRVYGSTRRNLIVDARPKLNALANRAGGGGIEDVANYVGNGDMPVEKVFLNIANIHVMRGSLDRVMESFANSDYIEMKPDQELLRKSGWLGHIAGVIDGAEMVARVIGLGGSHVLIHCSDGWDRTSQVSALAQIMLDPHYRTLEGFISLVQKDFISFGHKFKDRNGIEGCEKWFEIENERIAPYRAVDATSSDPNSLNAFGAKALSGAKNWFGKNRGNLFRQQNRSRDILAEHSPSRQSTPPPNPVIHSPPPSTGKEEKKHHASEDEISPIFHQFLDSVFQLQWQYPNAFEFNERFLRRLFYHTYACQYGEFLFNTEKERSLYKGKVASVWTHFLTRRQEFVHHDYAARVDDPLMFPKRKSAGREVEVRWWSNLFQRQDEEMNIPQALAPTGHQPVMAAMSGASVSFDDQALADHDRGALNTLYETTTRSKSTPDLNATGSEAVTDSFAELNMGTKDTQVAAETEKLTPRPDMDLEVLSNKEVVSASKEVAPDAGQLERVRSQMQPIAIEYDGDPLGVMKTAAMEAKTSELDFASFASQTAFRDR